MKEKLSKSSMTYKIIAFAVFIILIIGLTVAVFPMAKFLKTDDGRQRLKQYIASYKTYGIFIFLFIQALQVVVALIPPIQIIGGALFGGIFGGILSVAGIFLGSAAVFVLVRTLGSPLVEAIVDKKHIKKFKFFEKEDRLELVLFILFLVPGTPKDSLAYLVPLTKISFRRFMLFVLPARIPAIMLSAFLGSSVKNGHLIIAAVLLGICIALGIMGIVFREKVINWLKSKKESLSQKKESK